MKFFETIKNYFAPGYDKKLANPVEDARVLAAMSADSMFLTATNGCKYYYYFARNEQDTSVAKYLLARNGVKTQKHRSSYYYVPRIGLRVKTDVLDKNQAAKDFIGSIDLSAPFADADEVQKRIMLARNQMKGKVK